MTVSLIMTFVMTLQAFQSGCGVWAFLDSLN